MKLGLVSPDFCCCLLSVSLSESPVTYLRLLFPTYFENPSIYQNKSFMILQTFNAVLKLSYKTILFDCSVAFCLRFTIVIVMSDEIACVLCKYGNRKV